MDITPQAARELLELLQDTRSRLSLGLTIWQANAAADDNVDNLVIAEVLSSFLFQFLRGAVEPEGREEVLQTLTKYARSVIIDGEGVTDLDDTDTGSNPLSGLQWN